MKIENDWLCSIIAILGIVVLGVVNLPMPFFGDQAFFLLGAKEIDEGLVLYRDFWDIKQPGIFFFYFVGGNIFGFTHIGIHLFELFYWLSFSIVLLWFFNNNEVFKNRSFNYLAPVMIVGTYYSLSYPSVLTQVEILVNYPLMLIIIFNVLYKKSNKKKLLWLFFSGVAGGLILYFKFIFAPLLVGFWLIIFLSELNNFSVYSLLLRIFILSSGIIIVWIPFIFYCYSNDILELCYKTFIVYPPLVLEYGQNKDINHLFNSIKSFFSKIFLILPLTLGSLFLLRKRFLTIDMWCWIIVSIFIIVIQRTSWYSYHFAILYSPIIILSLIWIDNFLLKLNFNKQILFLFIFILIFINSISLAFLAKKIINLSKFNFALTNIDKTKYSIHISKHNYFAYNVSQQLNSISNDRCPIFVVDDPLIYYYTKRNQAISQSGWSMHLFLPGQLDILESELKIKKPCYIFIRSTFNYYFETKGKRIYNWVKENYSVLRSSIDGIWYKLEKT